MCLFRSLGGEEKEKDGPFFAVPDSLGGNRLGLSPKLVEPNLLLQA
jgi:hypothetical protein